MCLAIVNTGKTAIPVSHLRNGFDSNPHGAGFCAYDPQLGLVMRKGFATFPEFLEAFIPHNGQRSIVHFRWATHGGLGMDMTHPFPLRAGAYLIHNGVIAGSPEGKHDTVHFIDSVLSQLPKKWYMNQVYRDMIGKWIGKNNKLAIMGPRGAYALINHEEWEYEKDTEIWYSNTDYLPWIAKTYAGTTGSRYFVSDDYSDYDPQFTIDDKDVRERLERADLLLGGNDVLSDREHCDLAEQLIADREELMEEYGAIIRDRAIND